MASRTRVNYDFSSPRFVTYLTVGGLGLIADEQINEISFVWPLNSLLGSRIFEANVMSTDLNLHLIWCHSHMHEEVTPSGTQVWPHAGLNIGQAIKIDWHQSTEHQWSQCHAASMSLINRKQFVFGRGGRENPKRETGKGGKERGGIWERREGERGERAREIWERRTEREKKRILQASFQSHKEPDLLLLNRVVARIWKPTK